MVFHDLFGDGKTKAGTASLTGAGLLYPVEPFENVGKVLGGYTGSLVAYKDEKLVLLPSSTYRNGASRWRKEYGVVEKIRKHLFQPVFVSQSGRKVRFEIFLNFNISFSE
jgi:hypothetical protein